MLTQSQINNDPLGKHLCRLQMVIVGQSFYVGSNSHKHTLLFVNAEQFILGMHEKINLDEFTLLKNLQQK